MWDLETIKRLNDKEVERRRKKVQEVVSPFTPKPFTLDKDGKKKVKESKKDGCS